MSQGGTDETVGKLFFRHGAEPSSDVHTSSNPLDFAPETAGYRSGGQALIVHQ